MWLQVIAFVFEWLSREAYPTLEGLVLVTGATAFLLTHASGAHLANANNHQLAVWYQKREADLQCSMNGAEEEARAIAESLKVRG